MENTYLTEGLIEKLGTPVRLAHLQLETLWKSGIYKNYMDLLPAFAESLGYNLVVNPDESLKIGEANGKDIVVYEEWGMDSFYFSFFHELGHNILHFKDGFIIELDEERREWEADVFACFFCSELFPEHRERWVEIVERNPCYNDN